MPTNFLSPSNGIPGSLLDQINVNPGDVLSGKTYLGSDGEVHSGTLSLAATATESDVLSGKTFFSGSTTRRTGSYSVTNKIQVFDIYHAPYGNEYRNGTASVHASSTIKWCQTGTVCDVPTDPYDNSINITSVSGNTITYNWRTHGLGVHCKLVVILE